MSELTNLPERIRDEAGRRLEPGHCERLDAIAADVERLQRGAKTLGHVVDQLQQMALDATGMHHVIGEDGDGDWGYVWESLYDIRPKALREAAEAIVQASPSLNSELLYDVSEDPAAAAYVEGYKDAHDAVLALLHPTPATEETR